MPGPATGAGRVSVKPVSARASLARRRLRGKIPQLRLALEGKIIDHHRFTLKMLWKQLGAGGELIGDAEGTSPPKGTKRHVTHTNTERANFFLTA